jgi:hypothetical protein
MDCPLLSCSRPGPCRSTSDLFAHTLFTSDKYCKGAWFTLCPRYRHQQINVSLFAGASAVSIACGGITNGLCNQSGVDF